MSIPEKHNCAVLYKTDDLRIEERKVPQELGANDVLVQVKSVGICGSDCHYWKHGAIGNFVVKSPMVLGHESAGVVVKVGSGVTDLSVGDRVAMEPGVPCRACFHCKTGSYNLCPDMKFFATPPIDGSLAGYVVHPADFCFKLPETVTLEEGAMCEPLSVGVYACERAGVTVGSRVAVLGSGPIGLVAMMAAKAYGASTVVMTDISDPRLEAARGMGATATVKALGSDKEVAQKIIDAAGGQVDVCIECTGVEVSTRSAIFATRSGGCVTLVGLGKMDVNLPLVDASCRQVDLKGIFRYRNTYPTCVRLLESKKINVQPLITHRYAFDQEQLVDGFETALTGKGGAIKVMFNL